jgi:hypothetical protein
MDKANQPTFAERTKRLRETAILLRDNAAAIGIAAETVTTEVLHMEAAAKRFQERTQKREPRKASTH